MYERADIRDAAWGFISCLIFLPLEEQRAAGVGAVDAATAFALGLGA